MVFKYVKTTSVYNSERKFLYWCEQFIDTKLLKVVSYTRLFSAIIQKKVLYR